MRVLLLMMTVLISVFARSQAVFEIETPASIKGFYKFGLGDSTVDYRWGNGNTANKSVAASLALGKDSLAREALELNVKGKIAVLYRGGASFTDIALRAQAAGAVACIIVNNRPVTDAAQGGSWPMAPSTGSENLKIPFIMVSQEDGALITNMIRKGEDVKGYIGKKRMLGFDVKVSKDWMVTPLYRTLPAYLAKKGMISDTLGVSVINAGSKPAKNIIVVADIAFGGKSIYADTLLEDSLAANGGIAPKDGDTMYYRFKRPFQPNYDLPTGTYTIKYYLRQLQVAAKDTSVVNLNDEFQDDNEAVWYFTVSDSTLAIGNIISYTSAANNNTVYNNKANWSTATNTGANLKDFKSCVAYKNKNLDKVNISSMDFLAYSFETNGNLQNSKVGVVVYKWKTKPGSIFDPNYKLTIDALTPVVESEFTFKNAFKSDYGTYSFKKDGLTLDPNEMYMFCVSTTTPSIGFGYNRNEPTMWPGIAFNEYFIMPAYSDGTFYTTGFGSDRIPAISLNFSEKAAKSSSKDIIAYSIVKPAINASIGVDKITVTVPNATKIDSLIAKFKLSPKATMTIGGKKQVSDTTVNNFTTTLVATITAEDGTTKTYDIILTLAPKSSEKNIVSCKQGTAFGLIENDKVTFNLPTGTDVTKLVFEYTVSPLAKAYIFDTLGADKDSTFTTLVTKVNASGVVKIKVVAEDGSFKNYDLIVKVVKSSSKILSSFKFTNPAATGAIVDGIVKVSVPKGTDVTKLIANFTSSALSKVYVVNKTTQKDSLQTSGVTVNNFSDTVGYKVVAEDGTSLVYKVVVTVLKSQGNSITKFGFVDPAVTGVITGTNILVKVPKATDFTTLIATFEVSTDAIVKVGNNIQVTGVTANDFTSPVSYVVTSEAGVSQTYKISVEESEPDNLCDIVSFGFDSPKSTGVISGNKITVIVPKGTDLKALVAKFTLSSGATVMVDSVNQVSGVTANDFTNVVKYDVTAANKTTKKSFEVTVKIDEKSALSELESANINVYPNPSKGAFKLNVLAGQLSIRIMDAAGREVYNFNEKNNLSNEISINLVDVENGTYFANIVNNGESAIVKLQIIK